ncbi:GntR family transcriptional regulator [Bosea caraganae]|uniref:GntR family transcriptional regulator n=1 Tax=Bosea caraganae TaxID=2763117 RepID=UPI0015F08848|nr:GntR family transcriptional regulator [Bosea caraganae]
MVLVRPKSLKELTLDELRRRIIDGRIGFGEALSENALASELGVSKTPVREALMQLRTEGLVDIQPQRGTYVFRLEAEQVVAISELRAVLEVAAIGMAMERAPDGLIAGMERILAEMERAFAEGDIVGYRTGDGEYHQLMVAMSGNDYLADAYALITFRLQALRSRLSRNATLNQRSIDQHREMLALARAGRGEELKALLASHAGNTQSDYLALLHAGKEALAS